MYVYKFKHQAYFSLK